MQRTPFRRLVRPLLGIVFAGALLGLAEVTARLQGVQPAYRPDSMGQWQMTPNLNAHQMTGMREPHDFTVTTNDHGLRTQAPVTAPAEQYRVAVMGDSTVFGWGVADNESIAETAQTHLATNGHPGIRVLNMGQPGYSTGMAGWLFEESVAAYKPDLTVVFVSMHDFNRTLISDVERVHGAASPTAAIRGFLVRNVALYEAMRRGLYPLADKAQLLPNEPTAERRVSRVSDDERAVVLARMRSVAGQWGGDVSMGFLPFYSDFSTHSNAAHTRPGLQFAQQWSTANSRPLFDLRACCSGSPADRTFPFDHGHLNALGNREVGVALARSIIAHSTAQPQRDLGR